MRARVRGAASRPRLSVFRSNRFVYGQIIDDVTGRTLLSADSKAVLVASKTKKSVSKSDIAHAVGRELAKKALEKQIKKVTFDRGGFRYQGRVRALAQGAREGGLEF